MNEYLPVSEQIRILFAMCKHPEGRPYTLREVSDAIGISLPTIGQVRSGRIQNPQLHTLRALASFFGVSLRYFEARTPEECVSILFHENVSREEPVAQMPEVALRAMSLSPRSQADVLKVIGWIEAAERQGGMPDTGLQRVILPGMDADVEET